MLVSCALEGDADDDRGVGGCPLDGCVRGGIAGELDKGRGGRGRSVRIVRQVDDQGKRVDRLHRVTCRQQVSRPYGRLGIWMAQGLDEPGVERAGVVDGKGGAARLA